MFNKRTTKFALPALAALVVIGCGGSDGGGSSTNGGNGGNGGNSGGGSGADSVNLTVAKGSSNGRYTSLKATNSSSKIVQIMDSNPTGAGVMTIIANVPDGGTGRTQGLQFQFNHDAALSTTTTFQPLDPGEVVYSEITLNVSNPADTSTKPWYATSGTVRFTEVTATRVTVQFDNVGLVATDETDATGTRTLSGTASGTFATE